MSGQRGGEIDRNQISLEIMNITPIMEEKENFKLEEESEKANRDEQFSFDQEFNFADRKEENHEDKNGCNLFVGNQ